MTGKLTCSNCHGEIIPGTLFCWRHKSAPPKIGEFTAERGGGQLVWRTTSHSSREVERMLAVVLDNEQVSVVEVSERESARPAILRLKVTGQTTFSLTVLLVNLMSAMIEGNEFIEVTRARETNDIHRVVTSASP